MSPPGRDRPANTPPLDLPAAEPTPGSSTPGGVAQRCEIHGGAPGWLSAALGWSAAVGLDARWGDALLAFPQDAAACSCPTSQGARPDAGAALAAVRAQAAQVLGEAVDAAQAAMFLRRFEGVARWLGQLSATRPEAALLRLGLCERGREILADRREVALRFRALTDFYFSQAGLLHHGVGERTDLPAVADLLRAIQWRPVGEGLAHGRVDGPSAWGPVHANLLRCEAGAARLEVRIWSHEDATASALAMKANGAGALAAISGGFFLYSEPDIAPPSRRYDPVGLAVQAGEVRSPPFFARSALLADASGWHIERVGPVGCSLWWPGGTCTTIASADDPRGALPRLWTRTVTERVDPAAGVTRVALVGTQVVAIARDGACAVPLNGGVLELADGSLPAGTAVGDCVRWQLPRAGVTAAMAGGPRLLRGGVACPLERGAEFGGSAPPQTFTRDETGDRNLLPRMAVGLDAGGRLWALAVDGRKVERALGMTLAQLGEVLAALGCTEAMALDGGSSKRMVVRGEVVDLPSTEVVDGDSDRPRIRPVHSALLWMPSARAQGSGHG